MMTKMTPEDALRRYEHVVRWSDEDACFIGFCPDLARGGMCHDDDPVVCYRKLGEVMAWFVNDEIDQGHPVPPSTRPEPVNG